MKIKYILPILMFAQASNAALANDQVKKKDVEIHVGLGTGSLLKDFSADEFKTFSFGNVFAKMSTNNPKFNMFLRVEKIIPFQSPAVGLIFGNGIVGFQYKINKTLAIEGGIPACGIIFAGIDIALSERVHLGFNWMPMIAPTVEEWKKISNSQEKNMKNKMSYTNMICANISFKVY